jgi:hypothetical protein
MSMTVALQLLVFVAAIAGLIAFGFYRDKKEHSSGQADARQLPICFPEHQGDGPPHRGASISRLG